MGLNIEMFDVPVCNSFKAKVLNDQLCYEVDPNLFIGRANALKYLKLGLVLVLDFNEDRQTAEKIAITKQQEKRFTIQKNMVDSAEIFINSLGNICSGFLNLMIISKYNLRTFIIERRRRLQFECCHGKSRN